MPYYVSWCEEQLIEDASITCSNRHNCALLPSGGPANTCAKFRWLHKMTGSVWTKKVSLMPENTYEWAMSYVYIQCKHEGCSSKGGGTQTTIQSAAFLAHCKAAHAAHAEREGDNGGEEA